MPGIERTPSVLRILTSRGRVFGVLGLVLALAGLAFGWRDIARVGALLLGLLVVVILVFPRRRLRLRIDREVLPPRVPFGERASVRVTFTNTGTRSTPLLLALEKMDYSLGNRPRFAVRDMPPGASRTLTYSIHGGVRGRHSLGPAHIEQQDPFRLTRIRNEIGSPEELVVLPRVVALPDRGSISGGTGTEGDIPLMLALHGEDDVSIRAFHEGDDLRRVHWPATAHRGEIMMRQEERPSQRRAILVLDARADAHRGLGAGSSLEWGVTAVASVAQALAAHDFLLFLVTPGTVSDGSALQPMPLEEIHYRLAVEQPATPAEHAAVLEVAARLSRDQGLVVLASAWAAGDPAVDGAHIRSRSGLALRFLIDAPTFEGAARAQTLPEPLPGWHTVMVRAGSSHAAAWERLLTAAGALERTR